MSKNKQKRETIKSVFGSDVDQLKILVKRAKSHPESVPETAKEWLDIVQEIIEENKN